MDVKILIVDDYLDLHKILTLAVKSIVVRRINNCPSHPQIRVEFSSAFHGAEAFRLASDAKSRRGAYDIVFMDILMPGNDGLETARDILAICPHTEVIFVTAHSTYTWEEISASVGCKEQVSILFKPFELEKLGNHVTNIIKRVMTRRATEFPYSEGPSHC